MSDTSDIEKMAEKKCIIKGCTRKQKCRGLCNPCYHHAITARRNREMTDEEMVALGLILPIQKRKQPIYAPWQLAKQEARKKKRTS